MYKGEILAVSPKGKGKQPDYITVLVKSEELLKTFKNNQKWLVVSDQISPRKIRKGPFEFDVDFNKVIVFIGSQIKQETKQRHQENYVRAFSQLSIFELQEVLNEFLSKHNVFATQVFQIKSEGNPLYDALVHYKVKGGNN